MTKPHPRGRNRCRRSNRLFSAFPHRLRRSFRPGSTGRPQPDRDRARNEGPEGVVMELEDGAFPLLKDIRPTCDINEGFPAPTGLCCRKRSRKAGMEEETFGINGKIFTGQGQAIQNNAAADARILVVGNPCNTNCLIAMNNAPDIRGTVGSP